MDVTVSTHATRTGRDAMIIGDKGAKGLVSTHATRTGRDAALLPIRDRRGSFNSRDPHGSRPGGTITVSGAACFNSRDPHGSRLVGLPIMFMLCMFQLTRPARVATLVLTFFVLSGIVSTHATRTGRDVRLVCKYRLAHGFQLTRPARVATIGA